MKVYTREGERGVEKRKMKETVKKITIYRRDREGERIYLRNKEREKERED